MRSLKTFNSEVQMQEKPVTVLRCLLLLSSASAEDIARKIGVSAASLSQTASGLDRGRTLEKIASFLGVNERFLLTPVTSKAILAAAKLNDNL
jgi:transcriptional regulator with XRE-family HTH domain